MIYTMTDGVVDRALLNIYVTKNTIPTGYPELDEMIEGGFQNGHLYILGGRPGIGKTAFALNIATNILGKLKKKVLYYSLHIEAESIVKRLIKMVSFGKDDEGLRNAADEIRDYDLIIDTDSNLLLMGERIDEEPGYDDISLVIIDDLQHLSSGFEPGGECRLLKKKAEEMDVPILLLCNLSGTLEERHITERRPILPDLYDAYYGDTALVNADVIMLLYRDEYYNPETELKSIAEVSIDKNSTGLTGKCELAYISQNMRFCSLERTK